MLHTGSLNLFVVCVCVCVRVFVPHKESLNKAGGKIGIGRMSNGIPPESRYTYPVLYSQTLNMFPGIPFFAFGVPCLKPE